MLMVLLMVAGASMLRPRPALAGCPPAIDIVGPKELAAQLSAELRTTGATPVVVACHPARLEISRAGAGYDLSLVDDLGRTSRRRVDSLRDAATWVESVLRREPLAPLMPAPIEEPPAATAVAQRRRPLEMQEMPLSGGPVFAVGFSRSYLVCGAVRVCARFRWVCLGADFRAARKVGDSAGYITSETTSTAFNTIGIVEVWRWARFIPYGGLGASWIRQSRTYQNASEQDDRGGFRLEVGASVLFPLPHQLALEARASIGIQPLADGTLHMRKNVILPGEELGDFAIGVSLRSRP
jgi:hypothetical protein